MPKYIYIYYIFLFLLDLGMQINQAMFAVNGRCGYVLKSDRLRNRDLHLSPDKVTKPDPWILTIEVFKKRRLKV